MTGWIGVNLDGALATYDKEKDTYFVKDPECSVLEWSVLTIIKTLLAMDIKVCVMTDKLNIEDIQDWLEEWTGHRLEIKKEIDSDMVALLIAKEQSELERECV